MLQAYAGFEVNHSKEVQVIRVIRTTLERRGKGVVGDPIRRIEQFWTLDGYLLAERDPETKVSNAQRRGE